MSVGSDTCTVTPLLLLHSLARHTCCTHPGIILASSSSHTHVYDALISHCTAESCSHALQLHLLGVTGAPAGGLGPSGGLISVGLSNAGAPRGGVNAGVSAATAALAAAGATGNIERSI